ncbi:MAG: hypothetical protein FOGNACKC_02726 [Anaerolineae bacterium]|nr:hypothetical protein [Anaerolineae bacterium]
MRWGAKQLFVALICLGGMIPPQAVRAQDNQVQIQADDRRVTVTWTPPPVTVAEVTANGQTFSRPNIAGLPAGGEPGQPSLPVYTGLVGLPPGGGAVLRVIELETELVSLPHPPLPAPTPLPVSFSDPTAANFGGPVSTTPDSAIYNADALFPATVAQLGEPRQVRNRRVASLSIFPARVDPVSRQMEVVRFIRLEVVFDQPEPPSLAAQTEADSFAGALAATLLNPAATGWTVSTPATPAPAPQLTAAAAGSVLKLVVKERGLYAITYADLQAAGWPVATLNPQSVQVSYGASFSPAAILFEGESDGVFNPGDRILFYAEPTFSRYTDEDVYFLSYNQPAPPRMASRSGNPQGLPAGAAWLTRHAEANTVYESLYAGYNGDHWYWNDLRQPDKTAASYALSLAAPQTGGPNATLTVWMRGVTNPAINPDHKVRVQVNGVVVGEDVWDGALARQAQFSVPANLLLAGNNQIRLSLPGVGTVVEKTLVDAVELKYPTASGSSGQLYFNSDTGQKQTTLAGWSSANLQVFDVSSPLQPKLVTGVQLTPVSGKTNLTIGDANADAAGYLVVPDNQLKSPLRIEPANLLADPPAGADYIIITHPNFAAAVAPLAAHRANSGLRVVTVTTAQVYDSFGGGRMSAEAIKAYLQHAYQSWPSPKPLYVLLVGDGSYDFKNYSGYNPATYLPPFLAQVDPWWGETAADNRLVTFDGNNFPDMLVGRLPVNSAAEATVVVNKIIRYETQPPIGPWNSRHLFVSGDRLDEETLLVSEIFRIHADSGYNKLSSPAVGYRYYYDPDISSTLPYIYSNNVTLRQQFVSAFNGGAGVVAFNGHSSWHQWNADPVFRWSLVAADNDVDHLKNDNRLPVVLEMTCFTGFFHHPQYPTMDESLLRKSGGGAIAVWGATGLGVASGHDHLQDGFYDAILLSQHPQLGAAVLAGKLQLLASGLNLDLLDTFTLFGDPAQKLNFEIVPFPEENNVYLPLILR